MRGLFTPLTLICVLLLNGVASLGSNNKHPRQTKSRVERTESRRSSTERRERDKRESRRELAKRREVIKRNPRLATLFKNDEPESDVERTDQPREALEWYLQKRLPKGEKDLPIERYFAAKEKITHMKRFSSAKGKNLPPQANGNDAEILDPGDGEFPNGTGGGGAGDGRFEASSPGWLRQRAA